MCDSQLFDSDGDLISSVAIGGSNCLLVKIVVQFQCILGSIEWQNDGISQPKGDEAELLGNCDLWYG